MSKDKLRDKRTDGIDSVPEENIDDLDLEAKINASLEQILAGEEDEDEDQPLWNFSEEDGFPEEAEEKLSGEEETFYREDGDSDSEDGDSDEEYMDDEGYDEEEDTSKPPEAGKAKSARPRPLVYVPVDDMEQELPLSGRRPRKKKKFKGLKIFGLLLLMALIAVGCAYGGVSYYYSDRFFEGTWINGINCSGMTAYEAETALAQNVEQYSIQILSRNLDPQTITGDQIGYSYLSSGEVLSLLKQQKPYEWIKGMYEQKSYTVAENIAYDRSLLKEQVKNLECAKSENQVEPEDAYVAFQNDQFVIVPETQGSRLNIKQAYQILDDAVAQSAETVDFNSAEGAYVEAEITSDSEELQSALEACNNYTNASITYTFGDETVTLDGSTIKDWLQFDEKGQLVWDDNSFRQHITDFVAELAATYNTVGTSREFYTTSGRVVYVYGANYGWSIDQASEIAQLTQEIQSGTQTTRDPVYSQTANSHGVNDLGDTYIEVDLSNQHMYYYQNGSVIFESDFVSGNMSYSDRQTHEGIYTLYYKKSPDVLRGAQKEDGTYEYEQDVTYWMPFDGGIGFHDASWRDYFGGDIYLTNGSHGCINLPTDSAAELYSIIDYNVPIVCFY